LKGHQLIWSDLNRVRDIRFDGFARAISVRDSVMYSITDLEWPGVKKGLLGKLG
jgi:hypothetical protein